MRTNARSLPALAAAFLLAASAAAVSGCGKTSSPPPERPPVCARPGITVTVFVDYDPTVTSPPTTVNKTIYLCEGKDRVQWVSRVGFISDKLKWKDDLSPFDEPPTPNAKNFLISKPPKTGTAGKTYEYEAELWLDATGTKRFTIEPHIGILP